MENEKIISIQRECLHLIYNKLIIPLIITVWKDYDFKKNRFVDFDTGYTANCNISLSMDYHGPVYGSPVGQGEELEAAIEECIKEFNNSIKFDREYNERLLLMKNVPEIKREDFVSTDMTRRFIISWQNEKDRSEIVTVYIKDNEDEKEYVYDKIRKPMKTKLSDEDLILEIVSSIDTGRPVRKLEEYKLRGWGFYPTRKQFEH